MCFCSVYCVFTVCLLCVYCVFTVCLLSVYCVTTAIFPFLGARCGMRASHHGRPRSQWWKTCFGTDYWDPLFLHGLLAPFFAQTTGTLYFGMDCWHLFMCIGGDPGFCARPTGVLYFDCHCRIGGHPGPSHRLLEPFIFAGTAGTLSFAVAGNTLTTGNLYFCTDFWPPVFLQWRKTCFGTDYWDPLFLHELLDFSDGLFLL